MILWRLLVMTLIRTITVMTRNRRDILTHYALLIKQVKQST